MRILFFGNGYAATLCLDKLKNKNSKEKDELLVITPPGGKFHGWHVSLADYCEKNKIKYASPENVNSNESVELFKNYNPDVIFSVYYTQLISDKILSLVKYAINFHPSLLPNYRGTSPLIWAIVNNEKTTGVTAHEMTPKVDTGKVYMQEKITITNVDTGYTLHVKAAEKCANMFEKVVDTIKKQELTFFYVNGTGSYYSSKTPRVNELNPSNQKNIEIYNIVRALAPPLPGAYIQKNSIKTVINEVKILNDKKLIHELNYNELGNDYSLFIYKNNEYLKTKDGFLIIKSRS